MDSPSLKPEVIRHLDSQAVFFQSLLLFGVEWMEKGHRNLLSKFAVRTSGLCSGDSIVIDADGNPIACRLTVAQRQMRELRPGMSRFEPGPASDAWRVLRQPVSPRRFVAFPGKRAKPLLLESTGMHGPSAFYLLDPADWKPRGDLHV